MVAHAVQERRRLSRPPGDELAVIAGNSRTLLLPIRADVDDEGGLHHLPQVAAALKDIGFAGPTEIQAEYPNGGADNAQDSITLPRDQVLGAMKRDLETLRRAFAAAGL